MSRATETQVPAGRLFIGGEWRDAGSGRTFTTYNPASGSAVAGL